MICFVSGGASCVQRSTPITFPQPPQVLTSTPSLQEIAQAVNRVADIQQLSCNDLTVDVLSMKVPKLRESSLNIQRDKNFRLKAGLKFAQGAGLDMGSNDQVFWFEVPERDLSRTMYYAEHAKYRQQLSQAILPVDPTWVMNALGLGTLDPSTVIAGPVLRPDGKLEVRSTIAMPNGTYQQVCFIDRGGFITDIYLYDPNGKQIAVSNSSAHRFYEEHQCVLPHSVTIELWPSQGPSLKLQIDIGFYAINQLLTGDPNVFTMPQTAANAVDLTTLTDFVPMSAAPNPNVSPVGYTVEQTANYPIRGTQR